MTPEDLAAIRAAHYPMTGEEDWCVGCQDGQYPCDVVALLAEVDRLRASVMDTIDTEPGRMAEAYQRGWDACQSRALPVIEAARGLIEHHPPRDPALAALRAALAAWDASAPDGRGSEEEK